MLYDICHKEKQEFMITCSGLGDRSKIQCQMKCPKKTDQKNIYINKPILLFIQFSKIYTFVLDIFIEFQTHLNYTF